MSPLLNRSTIDRISNQSDILCQIVQIYLETTQDDVGKINAGLSGGDINEVAMAAHSLKGSSAELGAERLAGLCQRLYMEAKTGNRQSAVLLAGQVSLCYRETSMAMDALEFS